MKKTIIRICSIAAIGLALTACNNDAANKKLIDADNSAIDQLVQDKIKTLDDSLDKACADQVLAAATEKAAAEAPKGGKPAHSTTAHHTTPAPAKKDEPKKPADPKADKMGGNANTKTNAETKNDKMNGNANTNTNADKKKSKMNGGN